MSEDTTFATVADQVRDLETTYGGAFERTTGAPGVVIVRMRRDDGSCLVGTGATTAAAVAHLAFNLKAYADATRGSI